MTDPAGSPIDPDDILRRTFTSVRRGLDPLEVQKFLLQLATEIRSGRERERELEMRLEESESQVQELAEMAPGRLSSLVGEETARILEAANSAASEIRARSEESVSSLLRDAQDEAQRLRQDASQELDRRKEEGAEALAQVRRQVDELLQQARADAEAEVESGRQRGREMFVEAQRVRERVLRDLARRRKQLRQQIEQLQAGRERLAAAYDVVRETLEVATEELRVVVPEAKLAAEAAALRAAEEEANESFEEEMAALEAEVDAGSAPDPSAEVPAADDEVQDEAQDEVPGPVDDLEEVEDEDDEEPEGTVDERDERDERDELAQELTRSLGRAVKRVISDEQNELLDEVRRGGADLDELLPTPEAHVERMAAAMIPVLTQASAAGAAFAGTDEVPTSSAIQDMAAEYAVELVAPLRDRLGECFAQSDDDDALVERLRDSYREWRTQQVDQLATRAVQGALDRGILDPSVP